MRWLRLLVFVLLVPVSACATSGLGTTYLVDVQGPYTLDSGDVLRIVVYGDAELSELYRVDDAGAISLPLIGPIAVRGETTLTAAALITSALANGYMRNPNVAVEVNQYRPFYIQGEVSVSGQYPYVYGMSVRAAISTAGGFTDTADRTKVVVYRRNGEEMLKGNVGLDFPVQPGDTLVILDRWI